MPRVKKTDVQSKPAADASVPVAASTEEKKQRKPNAWNVYYKDNHKSYKEKDEHKGKSHQDLTKIMAADYRKSKETTSSAAASDASQQ